MRNHEHPAGHILQAFQDGELDPGLATEVATHCEQCGDCRKELADLERTVQLLKASPAPELPRTVWHRVRPGRAKETRFKPALAFAAGAVGVVLGVLLGPIPSGTDQAVDDLTWSENVTIWNGDATSSLLGVYQTGQD